MTNPTPSVPDRAASWTVVPRLHAGGTPIRLYASGQVNLPVAAYRALGKPDAVVVLTNGARGVFALRPAALDEIDARPLSGSPKRGDSKLLNAAGLRALLGFRGETRVITGSWTVEDGLLIVTIREASDGN